MPRAYLEVREHNGIIGPTTESAPYGTKRHQTAPYGKPLECFHPYRDAPYQVDPRWQRSASHKTARILRRLLEMVSKASASVYNVSKEAAGGAHLGKAALVLLDAKVSDGVGCINVRWPCDPAVQHANQLVRLPAVGKHSAYGTTKLGFQST